MSHATESIVKVTITWPSPIGAKVYSDKTVTGEKGSLLTFDVVNMQGQTNGVGEISSVNVVLDDSDGTLKTYHDAYVIEGLPCSIVQVFTGGVSKSRTILSGKICADIVWSEGERTLSFGVESTVKDIDVGYAPEDGDYAWLHPDAIGQAWPLCFGSVLRVPAVHALKPYELSLAENVTYGLTSWDVNNGSNVPQSPTVIRLDCGEVIFTGSMVGDTFTPLTKNDPKYTAVPIAARIASDEDFANPNVFWVDETHASYNLMRHYCLFSLGGGRYTVILVNHQEGNKCWSAFAVEDNYTLDTGDTLIEVARYPRTGWPVEFRYNYDNDGDAYSTVGQDTWTLLKDAEVYYRPSATITDRYICNLIPSSSVVEVKAYRTFFGKKILCEVPSSYYTLNLSETLGTKSVTSITMEQPLSSIFCEGWEDDLYVSLVSTVGNNTADIISWLLTTYGTGISIGSSFATTHISLDNYPSNFALFDVRNLLDLCKDIAWQARCALSIINGTAELYYLPSGLSATPVETITNLLTEFKSISLGFTTTENLITKITARWLREYSGFKVGVDGKNPERKYIKELNISTYGLQKMEKDFFIYNIGANVEASVDFWMNRMANVWRTISCNCFIDIDDVKVYDIVLFNNSGMGYPSGGARGVLTHIGHNTGEPIVELSAELSIKAGSMSHSADYWSVGAGDDEDVLDSLATEDYEVASDGTCPDFVVIYQDNQPVYHFVFVEVPKQIPRGHNFNVKIEIQDDDGNLVTSLGSVIASLEIHSADRWDVPNHAKLSILVAGGKWDNGANPLQITGGDKHSISHLWIKSLDRRVKSSKNLIGSE